MRKLFSFVVDFAWAGIAAILIASAALVTIVRLLLPEIDGQRVAVAAWVSETVGRPALIGNIEASWDGWAPQISVDDIAILSNDGDVEVIRFEHATISLAPLRSLLSGSLKPNTLTVSGVELALVRDEQGRISVAGLPPTRSPVLRWLLQQDNFAVTRADLTFTDLRADRSYAVSDLTLTIRNHLGSKVVTTFVDLPTEMGGRLVISFTARGDPLSSEWEGGIDFSIADIDSEYLIKQSAWHGQQLPSARLNFAGSSVWRDAQLQSLRFDVGAMSGQQEQELLLSALGQLTRDSEGWQLHVVDIELPDAAGEFSDSRFSMTWAQHRNSLSAVTFRGHDLPVAPLSVLTAGLTPLPQSSRELLEGLQPSGSVEHVEAVWRRGEGKTNPHYATAAFRKLSSHAHRAAPAIEGLDAELSLVNGDAALRFADADFTLKHAQRLAQPLEITGLNGRLVWDQQSERLDVYADDVAGTVNKLALTINGKLKEALGVNRYADLHIAMPGGPAANVHHLIPNELFPPRGQTWLRQVLQAGRLSDGAVVVRGPLSAFPFRHAEGVFAVDFSVSDALVQYSARWPAAESLRGNVSLRGEKVRMRVEQANVLAAHIEGADITMADLFTRQRFVHINGQASGPGNSGTAVIMASPLKNGKAARMADIDIGSTISVDLDMDIGLFPDGPREVLGRTRFSSNRIAAPKLRIVLDDVQGSVSFTHHDWYGEDLSATFEGIPVGLVFNGGLNDPNYDSEMRMTGTPTIGASLAVLEKYSPAAHRWMQDHRLIPALEGESPWKAVLTIPTVVPGKASLPRRLRLESSLFGLTSTLPWPLNKLAQERKPLSIDLDLREGIAERVRLDYGDIADVEFGAQRGADGKAEITRAEILLGTVDPEFKRTAGTTIRGYVDRVRLDEWSHFQPDASVRTGTKSLPLNFDLQVSKLELLGQAFDDVRMFGEREATQWQVGLAGATLNGTALVPRDFSSGTLHLNVDRLELRRPDEATDPASGTSLDPRRVPALAVAATTLVYNEIDFGAAEITTVRHSDGLELTQLKLRSDALTLDANGRWDHNEGQQTSHFDIDVQSATLAGLLERFGYNVANIEQGETDIHIAASWPGTPFEFSLAQMTGNFELHVTDGRFLDIEPGGGRLFGLLSLQSLPRRLSLDFDDLFRKGFAFDDIQGVFELENGNAYTNSLLMSGPSARIDITGRTGLADTDYDQHMVVTPALSSSLPVAAALFGPIGVGAGAVYFLGQKMFKAIPNRIDKFLRREYSITGSWDNPLVERI